MGVPAFFRWVTLKYPRIIQDVLEDRAQYINGTFVPVDPTAGRADDIEFDNLYLDMNGCVPCSGRRLGWRTRPRGTLMPLRTPQHRPQLHTR